MSEMADGVMNERTASYSPRSTLRGLYAVTPDEADTDRLVAMVTRVLEARPALLQYRSKTLDALARRGQAEALLRCCRKAGVPFIVNDDLALALAIGADGAHLGRDDGDLAAARTALGPARILGVSCYDEWARAESGAKAGADYLAFGALFASPTKPQARRAPFDLLTRARRELGVAVAAIGGITLDNAAQVIDAGADLVAVITDVFSAPDPAARARAYRGLFAAPGV